MSAFELTWFMRMFGVPLGMFVLLRRAALARRELNALLLVIAVMAVYLATVSLLEVPVGTASSFHPGSGIRRSM